MLGQTWGQDLAEPPQPSEAAARWRMLFVLQVGEPIVAGQVTPIEARPEAAGQLDSAAETTGQPPAAPVGPDAPQQ